LTPLFEASSPPLTVPSSSAFTEVSISFLHSLSFPSPKISKLSVPAFRSTKIKSDKIKSEDLSISRPVSFHERIILEHRFFHVRNGKSLVCHVSVVIFRQILASLDVGNLCKSLRLLSDRFKMLMSIKHSDSENIAELS
jgi:hypothetical protein